MNAVMVVARKPEGLTRASALITRLDRADPAASMVKVYQVKYGRISLHGFYLKFKAETNHLCLIVFGHYKILF